MEERQTQIKEGAGLQESRLNEDFINFLQRWGTPALLVVAVIALGYFGYQRLQMARTEKVNQAFVELEAALSTTNPNPRALEDIAATYSGTRAVPHIASLAAADEYLRAARVGIAPGATIGPGGAVESGDLLSDEQRERYLSEAARLFEQVLSATHAQSGMAIHAMSAAYGLAAVAESRNPPERDQARAEYERIISIAERAGYELHARNARHRIETMDERLPAERPRLYAASELPAPPVDPNQTPESAFPSGIDINQFIPPTGVEPDGDAESPTPAPAQQPTGTPAGEPAAQPGEQPSQPPAEPQAPPAAPDPTPDPAPQNPPGPG